MKKSTDNFICGMFVATILFMFAATIGFMSYFQGAHDSRMAFIEQCMPPNGVDLRCQYAMGVAQ